MKTLKQGKILFLLTILMGFLGCKEDPKTNPELAEVPGIDLELMDQNVKPSNDFFRYVNGKWLDKTEIPADRARWGSFDELRQKTDEDALGILKAAMSDNKDLEQIQVLPGSDQEKAVKLFQTIMDTVSRNQQGIEPLKPYLAKIDALRNMEDLQALMIEMEPQGGIGFFGFGVGADAKNSDLNAGYLSGSRLGLPDRDYYVKDDPDSKEIRAKYEQHIARMLQFIGVSDVDAAAEAAQVLAFETSLAEPRMDKVERRNPDNRYNPRSMEDLAQMMPAINWPAYFQGIGVKELDTVIVSDVKYMDGLQKIFAQNNVDDWKAYLRWSVLNDAADLLTTEIDRANWEFYGKELRGTKAQRPREERALQTLNWTIGEALGKLYVDKKFPPEAKQRAEEMIQNVITAYERRINALDWMSADTKQKAIEKLKSTKIKIAYPDRWKDYSALEVQGVDEGGTYLQNMLNASQWNYKEDLDKLGKAVDKSEWFMAPQVVNAYYNPSYNEIVFPAAILQPPFFNFTADDAVNYGGIGAVIGHEISHSFDDQGAKFDADGNLKNWWTDEDLEKFQELGAKLAAQYDALEPLPDVFVNGKFTLGENIGDLGGVNAAYDALQISFAQNGRPENIDGFTPEQRFFMSWATVWRTKSTDEALNNQVKTDPHSPGIYRAMQPLRNIDAFYEAFNVTETDSMYIAPTERVKIW